MDDFFIIQPREEGGLEVHFKSPLFHRLVEGLPVLWGLMIGETPSADSKTHRRLFGTPHAAGEEDDFWPELVVPDLQTELQSDRDLIFRDIADWTQGSGSEPSGKPLAISENRIGVWIGVLGQIRLMISEETGLSEEQLSKGNLSDRHRALALALWVYGALIEGLMPFWV